MKAKISREDSKDFSYRYQDTYGFLTTNSGKKLVVLIQEVGPQYTAVIDLYGNKYQLNTDTGCELEFTQVMSGWFNPEPGVIVYMYRKPEKQWKRGISKNNTGFKYPIKDSNMLEPEHITTEKLSQLFYFDPDVCAFEDIIEDIPPNCVVWSKYFACAGKYLWAKDVCIGEVDHKKLEVILTSDLLKQEVTDVIRRNKLGYTVNVI